MAAEVLGGPGREAEEPPPDRGPHEPGERAGRFHTVRGPMGVSGWVRYPAAWWRARSGRTPERPWIVPAAVGWLRRRIRSDWSVLELGSGRSTVWFARRAGSVLSFEDNEYLVSADGGAAQGRRALQCRPEVEGSRGFSGGGQLPARVVVRPGCRRLSRGSFGDSGRCRQTSNEEVAARWVPAARRFRSARVRGGVRVARGVAIPALHRRQGRVARGLRDRSFSSTVLIRVECVDLAQDSWRK